MLDYKDIMTSNAAVENTESTYAAKAGLISCLDYYLERRALKLR